MTEEEEYVYQSSIPVVGVCLFAANTCVTANTPPPPCNDGEIIG